jgi:hypothetical protein
VSTLNSLEVITVPANSWSTDGSQVTSFSATLHSGSYRLVVGSTPNGFFDITDVINVQYPANAAVTSPQQVSFNGGTFTIQGSYLSPVSFITVNGFKAFPIATSNSEVTYSIPPLVTATSQTTFGLKEVGLIDRKQYTYFNDSGASLSVDLAFDGLITTSYASNSTT